MTATATKKRRAPRLLTAADYMALSDDGRRYELIDGELVMSPSPIYGHNAVELWVAARMQDYVDARRLGTVNIETDVVLDKRLVFRPDIHFVARSRRSIIRKHVYGAPDLAVEVTSPDNRPMDLFTKRRDYERYGVREYWILDIARQPFAAYQWHLRGGRYAGGLLDAAVLRARVIRGFSLKLKDIWERAAP